MLHNKNSFITLDDQFGTAQKGPRFPHYFSAQTKNIKTSIITTMLHRLHTYTTQDLLVHALFELISEFDCFDGKLVISKLSRL